MNDPRQPQTRPTDRPLFIKCYDKDGNRIAPVMTKPAEPVKESIPADPERFKRMQKLLFERIRREVEAGTLEAKIAALREQSRLAEQEFKASRSGRSII